MFELSIIEKEKLNKWIKKHHKKCINLKEGHLTYMFTPMGIGNVIEVQCSCGDSIDVTDSSNW